MAWDAAALEEAPGELGANINSVGLINHPSNRPSSAASEPERNSCIAIIFARRFSSIISASVGCLAGDDDSLRGASAAGGGVFGNKHATRIVMLLIKRGSRYHFRGILEDDSTP